MGEHSGDLCNPDPEFLTMNKTILFTFCLGLVLILCLTTADADAVSKRQNKNSKNVGKSGKGKVNRRRSKNNRRMKKQKKGSSKNSKNKKDKRKKLKQRKSKKGSTRNSGSSGCGRQSTTFCPAEKAQALTIYYKQLKRAENWAKIVSKKKGKKDNFVNDALILEDAVGGNLSAPACSSRSRSDAATATEKGEVLKNCSASIAESCADIVIDTTVSGDCKTKMETFQTKVDGCKTGDDCTCWTEAFAMKSDLSSWPPRRS